jgi:hypothetical protein
LQKKVRLFLFTAVFGMDMAAQRGGYQKAGWSTGGLKLIVIANGIVRPRKLFVSRVGTF